MRLSRGVYGVYDRASLADDALARVDAVLEAGLACLQYRDKRDSAPDRGLIAALGERCRARKTAFIINDDWRLARAVGADGVHLGQSDGDVAQARAALGDEALIGVSCQDRIERARAALAAGADHVSFGRFFVSSTKPDAPAADPAVLGTARGLGAPVVAIGGITADNAPQLIAAGADLVAVSSALFRAPDGVACAYRLRALFSSPV